MARRRVLEIKDNLGKGTGHFTDVDLEKAEKDLKEVLAWADKENIDSVVRERLNES